MCVVVVVVVVMVVVPLKGADLHNMVCFAFMCA